MRFSTFRRLIATPQGLAALRAAWFASTAAVSRVLAGHPLPIDLAGSGVIHEPVQVGEIPPADLNTGAVDDNLFQHCVIIPHATPRPDPLAVDIHTAVMHVLQRVAHRDRVDIRDPMDIVTIARQTPEGPRYATVIRWYLAGERPIDDLDLDDDSVDATAPAALPRKDESVRYEPPTT